MMQMAIDRDAVLAEALRRARQRRDLATSLTRLGSAAADLEDCLEAAARCVRGLARPAASIVPVSLAKLAHDLQMPALLGRSEGPSARSGRGFVYLLTCGYDSREAMARLDGDYTSYHLQDAMAREIVFALGRDVMSELRNGRSQWHFARHVICDGGPGHACRPSPRVSWDPRRVSLLLRWFDGTSLGVRAMAAGTLAPLHSLLGIAVGSPPMPCVDLPAPSGTCRE